MHKHNENNDNKIEPNNDENIDQAGVPEENINQAGVPQDQLLAIPEQPEPYDGLHIVEDKSVATANNDDRPNCDRRTVERLTYETLGKTHQQSDTQNMHPDAILEQCHNITTTDAQVHKDENYNPDKANIIACAMVQIYKQAQLHGVKFLKKASSNLTKLVRGHPCH